MFELLIDTFSPMFDSAAPRLWFHGYSNGFLSWSFCTSPEMGLQWKFFWIFSNTQNWPKNYTFATKDDYAGLSWDQVHPHLTGAFSANWPSSHLGTLSSSESLESYSCNSFQTLKGFAWFYMKPGGKGLWLVMYCSERLCEKPSMTHCTRHACFMWLKFSQI